MLRTYEFFQYMISLIHPSRGRPEKAKTTLDYWWQDYMRGHHFDHILSIDSDDPAKDKYLELFPIGYTVLVNHNKSVVEATNKAADYSTGDIILYLSDDFRCPKGWIELVEKEFEGCTTPRILRVDDNLQGFNARVLTIPIMNRAALTELGYFYNPLYKSMWVDCDLYEVAERRGWLKPCKNLVFPHDHVSNGKSADDETYRRSAANWDQGKAVFDMRKRNGFI